ncbi:hypothetical protein G6L37_00135 [Agrobacterium rubi]|nr:hypothetical protein [Agrobacterium rubi]NTF23658.1 hypothetical protein [Agrobacterium rubi]
MKAFNEVTYIQLRGEEGRRIVVVFSNTDGDVSARLLFTDEWGMGREVQLDQGELDHLRGVLLTDAAEMRKNGAYLKLSDGDLNFTVRDTNRGEPYRDGFDFNLEQDWEGYPVFVEMDECREFAALIGKTLGYTPSPSRR